MKERDMSRYRVSSKFALSLKSNHKTNSIYMKLARERICFPFIPSNLTCVTMLNNFSYKTALVNLNNKKRDAKSVYLSYNATIQKKREFALHSRTFLIGNLKIVIRHSNS